MTTITEQPITRSELREEFQTFRDELRQHYATKADVADVRTEMSQVRVEVSQVQVEVSQVRVEVSEVRVELHQMENRLIKWMVGSMLGSVIVAVSLALLVQRIVSG